VFELIAFELEIATEKLKRHISPGIDQIPAKLIKAEGRTICCELHKLIILFGKRRNCLRSGRSRSLCLFIRRAIKQTNNYRGLSLLPTTYKYYPISWSQS
jgi:hypothetical protein